MGQDPLIKSDKWDELENEFEKDYPRGVAGFNILQTHKIWLDKGIDNGLKVFCPYNEARNGIIAFLSDQVKYELHIECPNEDTSELEEALKKTKHVNWDRIYGIVLFPPFHAVECIKGVVKDIGKEITKINPVNFYVLDRRTPLFDVDLLPGFTFQQLSQKHIEIVDSTWPHRYPGSIFYFELLIRANSGYGLFKDQELVSFGFIKETGALGHLYTLENQRRKGYGHMFLKMFCNVLLKEGRHINSYCLKTNAPACRMHEEFGFKKCGEVALVNIQ